jgi:hypothetical protein
MGKTSGVLALWLAALVLLGSAGPAAAQKLISLVEFRDRVAAEVRRQQPQASVVLLGQTGLRVVIPGDEPKDQSMERAYSLYRDDPGRLSELVASYGRSFIPAPITPQSLRVLVRTDRANPPPGPAGDRGLVRPIAGGLLAIVAVDGPDNYEFLRASILRSRLKLDDAAIWNRALANTRAAIPFKPQKLVPGQPARLAHDGLSSSLLADDAFWNAPAMTAQGPIVVAAPGRDEIFLMLASDQRMVAAVRQELARVADDPDTLFPRLLVRRNGRWEVLP